VNRLAGVGFVGAIIAIIVVLANGVGHQYQIGGDDGFTMSGGAVLGLAAVIAVIAGVVLYNSRQ
jgi:hypothetical protein